MSELLLPLVLGRSWRGGRARLVDGCRSCRRSQIAPRYDNIEASSALPRPAITVIGTILRRLTSCNSSRGLSFLCGNVSGIPLTSVETRAYWRVSSIPRRRNVSEVFGNKRETTTYDERSKNGTADVAVLLRQHLGLDVTDVERCVKDHKGFSTIDPADISLNYLICREAGFSDEAIKRNPGLLSYPHRILKAKVGFVANMNMRTIDDAIPFVRLGISALRSFSEKLKYETLENGGLNRITYLAEQLQCPPLAICHIVAKYYFMRTVPLAKLEQVLQIMLDFHVSKDDILNDVWAFRYNPDLITERLKRVTDAGVCPVKPWMIRCQEVTLSSRIKKAVHRRSVLGDGGTVTDYLAQRLECNKREITQLLGKNPKIARVSGPKLKRLVDFFLENGYTVEHVLRAPRVLFHKLETMQERLAELQRYGHKPKSLLVFCKSKREYDVYLEMVKLRWTPPIN